MHLKNCHSNESLRTGDNVVLPRNNTVCACVVGPSQKLDFKLLRIIQEVLAEDQWFGDASSLTSNCGVNTDVDFE